MDSVVRDSKVNPIGDSEAEEEAKTEEARRSSDGEESLLLGPGDGGCKDEVKPKAERKVKWNDANGNELAQIMEFLPSDVSDSDEDESDSCFCIIM